MRKLLSFPVLVVIVLAVATAVYAATLLTADRNTGTFKVDSTGGITVQTLKVNGDGTKVVEPSPAWCALDPFPFNAATFCALRITNNLSTAQQYDLSIINVDNSDGKGFSTKLNVRASDQSTATACTTANGMGPGSTNLLTGGTSDVLLSSAPAVTNLTLPANMTFDVCIRLTYNVEPQIFEGQTSATFRVHAHTP